MSPTIFQLHAHPTKRALSSTISAVVGGVLGGVAAICSMVLAVWVIHRIWKRRRRSQLRISGPLSVENEEARHALRLLQHARQSSISATSGGLTKLPQRRSEHDTPFTPKWRISSTSSLSVTSHHSSQLVSEDIEKPAAVASNPLSGNTQRRSLDAETASIYSSVSAPLEYHETLFCAPLMVLDPYMPASAPAWITDMSSQQASRINYPVLDSLGPRSHGAPYRHPRTTSACQAKSINRRDDQNALPSSPSPKPAHTHSSSWSRRAEIHPPTRIHWRVPGEHRDGVSPGVISQPVADGPSLPSPPPSPYPSFAPLNIRSKTTRNKSTTDS